MTKAKWLRRALNLWPPFLFNGIRVLRLDDDYRSAQVRLRLHWYNRNYVGVHFGGALFSMTDPFFVLLMMGRLGRGYIVWDQAAEIRFVRAVREDVFAEFRVDDALLESLREAASDGQRHLRWLDVTVKTASGEVVAEVRKQLYIRRKPEKKGAGSNASG